MFSRTRPGEGFLTMNSALKATNRMSVRIRLSKGLIRLANGMKFLGLVVMKPDDLIEFTQSSYARSHQVASWSDPRLVEGGLFENETALLERIPIRSGRLLLLGVGGGREAVPLAKQGFEIIGVDFVPEMVAQAQAAARRRDVEIGGLVQDISRLQVPAASFDVIWFSAALYSSVPSRARRVEMLRRVHQALRPEGYVVCQFSWNPTLAVCSPLARRARALVDRLGFGLRRFECGDQLLLDREFHHSFVNEDEVRSEMESGGFLVKHLDIREELCKGAAILVKG